MEKLRVAAYCRVSTRLASQMASANAQARHYEELICREEDWELAGVFVAFGRSGARMENRPALQQLLARAREGRVDRILTKSISRFSRNTMECLQVVRELRALGVGIFFEKENIDTEAMGSEFLLDIFASFAEEESRQVSDNCKWGIRERFRQGTYLPAVLPYGYRKAGDGVEIDEDAANVVRRAFANAASGATANAIAKAINAEGRPSPRGGKWSVATVRAILRNPFYVGDLHLQKTYRDAGHRQRPNEGELDRYLIRGHHEAIVDEALFRKVQENNVRS